MPSTRDQLAEEVDALVKLVRSHRDTVNYQLLLSHALDLAIAAERLARFTLTPVEDEEKPRTVTLSRRDELSIVDAVAKRAAASYKPEEGKN